MNSLFAQFASIVNVVFLVGIFVVSARHSRLGAASLPCFMVLTSLIYFYAFPATWLLSGGTNFFGLDISDLTYVHLASFLYCLGAVVAFVLFRRWLLTYVPVGRDEPDISLVSPMMIALWVVAAGGIGFLAATGRFTAFGGQVSQFVQATRLTFAFQAFTMIVPLTLVAMIRSRFSWWSLVLAAITVFILVQSGFRFRILMFGAASLTAFALVNGLRIRSIYILAGSVGAAFLLNLLGAVRRYGQGVDLAGLGGGSNLSRFLTSFGGELGPVFITARFASQPLPDPNYIEPWVVGFARLVPSVIWPDKPTAYYLVQIAAGLGGGAERAGIAAPQHVEMMLQLGWPGLFILSFLYFTFALWLLSRISKLPPTPRIAGYALVPIFFGYYMQSRGYFFQILVDGLCVFGPLFLLSLKLRMRPAPAPQLGTIRA